MSAKAAGISPDYIQLLAQRNALLEAAKAYIDFCKDVSVSPVAPELKPLRDALRQAIAACEKA